MHFFEILNHHRDETTMASDTLTQIPFESEDLDFLRDLATKQKIQYFNARFSQGQSTSISILKKISKTCKTGIGNGFSISAFTDGGWGLAIGKEFSKTAIKTTFLQAAKLARFSSQYVKEKFTLKELPGGSVSESTEQKVSLMDIGADTKIQRLLEMEQVTYVDPKIISTSLNYSDHTGEMVIFNNFGRFVRAQSAGLYIGLQAIAKDGTNQQGFHVTHGAPGGYETLQEADWMGPKAGNTAIELLDSSPAKPGKFDIIMDPALTGTFIHEAFGHAAEADAILANESILLGKVGKQVGSNHVTIIDDPTMPSEFGTYVYDDEGTLGEKVTIVKDGVLQGYIHSLETASKMDVPLTGNSRAAGFSVRPQVRMSNTYLSPGDSNLDEMIEEMKDGLLCVGWKYGYCDPSDGAFQFQMAKAYEIKDGKKVGILRDAAISGLTLDVLNRVDLLGSTLEQDSGHCGKGGQSVPVGSGGPYTMIRDMVIGGQ